MHNQESLDRSGWLLDAFERYESRLVGYAANLLGDVDRARRGSGHVRAIVRSEPSKTDGRLAQWLFTVCRNQALDARRKEVRMKTFHEQRAAVCESRDADPNIPLKTQETAARAMTILKTLRASQQ